MGDLQFQIKIPRKTPLKTAHQIKLMQTTISLGETAKRGTPEPAFLNEKIEQYLLKLGYSNVHVLGIVVNLLTMGKIMVEFRNYIERLELADRNDLCSMMDAVGIYDAFMAEMIKDKGPLPAQDSTGTIVIESKEKPPA